MCTCVHAVCILYVDVADVQYMVVVIIVLIVYVY